MRPRCYSHALLRRSALALALAAGVVAAAAQAQSGSSAPSSSAALSLPPTLQLTGVVRDFRKWDVSPGGHPDFQRYNVGHRVGLVSPTLGEDGKPVLASRTGQSVGAQFKDRHGRQIRPADFDPSLGDRAGSVSNASTAALTSAESFAQWFRDVPGVNLSKTHTITLNRVEGTNRYSFRAADDMNTSQREGFFPADGQLFNDNDPTWNHNYHLTFELITEFTYKAGSGQFFTFEGDDDVYVFIDGKLAIDLGGVHSAIEQTVDIDRFAAKHGLQDGRKYSLHFFFAERHTTRSNCRIETDLTLVTAELPTTAALHD